MAVKKTWVPYIRRALQAMPPKFVPPTEGYLRHQGLDTDTIKPMGLNECLFPPSPRVIAALRENLDRINRYPDAQCPALSDIISARTSVPADSIAWGNGSEELIKGSVALSISPGDGLVLPVPTFWGYRAIIQAAEADTAFIDMHVDGAVNVGGIIDAVDNRTHLVFCITPNNPSGAFVPEGDFARLAGGVPENVLFVIDEAYHEFGIRGGGPDILCILSDRRGPWIVIRTFSKAYAMAGMRLGFALCSDAELAQALMKTTCVFNVPILAQFAGEAALADADHLENLLEQVAAARTQVGDGLRALGLEPLTSVTNFVSTRLPVGGREVARQMLDRGVQIHAWPDPGYENFIRITVGPPKDNAFCLAALKEVLAAE